MTTETLVSTFAAAFAGSFAALVMSFWIDSRAKRRKACTDLLVAINRQCDRLIQYAVNHGNSVVVASRNHRDGTVPGAPSKPPMKLLETELLGVGSVFSGDSRCAIVEIVEAARKAEVPYPDKPDNLADWELEVANLQSLAQSVAAWDGRKPALPTQAELGNACVMS